MNLKKNSNLPSPPELHHPYLLFSITHPTYQIVLYSPPSPPQKQEEPNKKKFSFKPKEAVNTS